MKDKIISETPTNLTEVKEILSKSKEKGELSFRAQKTYDHLESLKLLSSKKAKELTKKLEDLKIPRLRDVHTEKLIDLLPKTVDDVKTVLQGYAVTITNDNMKKIANAIKEFTK